MEQPVKGPPSPMDNFKYAAIEMKKKLQDNKATLANMKTHYERNIHRTNSFKVFVKTEAKQGNASIGVINMYDNYVPKKKRDTKASIIAALYSMASAKKWNNMPQSFKEGRSVPNPAMDYNKLMAVFECLAERNLTIIASEFVAFIPGLLVKVNPDERDKTALQIPNGRIDFICENAKNELVILQVKTMPPITGLPDTDTSLENDTPMENYLLREAFAFQLEMYCLILETMALSMGITDFRVAETGLILWNIHGNVGECKLYMLKRHPELIINRVLRNLVPGYGCILPQYAKDGMAPIVEASPRKAPAKKLVMKKSRVKARDPIKDVESQFVAQKSPVQVKEDAKREVSIKPIESSVLPRPSVLIKPTETSFLFKTREAPVLLRMREPLGQLKTKDPIVQGNATPFKPQGDNILINPKRIR